jgi:GH24 family phage-related lysozyme (muramidase)
MDVEFEGAKYKFPDTATKDQVFSYLKRNRKQDTSEETAQAPTIYESSKAVPEDIKYYGNDAIKKVEEMNGQELTYAQRRVVEEEGFVDGFYKDTKGITTYGVGQTNEYMDMPFSEVYAEHEEDVRRMMPGYDAYPEYLQAELMSAAYRGDLGGSPTFRRLMNAGKYEEAAVEFLNHQEYNDRSTPIGIKKRLRKVQDAVKRFAEEAQQEQEQTAQVDLEKLKSNVPEAPAFDNTKAKPVKPGQIFEDEDEEGNIQFWKINEDGEPEIFNLGDQKKKRFMV